MKENLKKEIWKKAKGQKNRRKKRKIWKHKGENDDLNNESKYERKKRKKEKNKLSDGNMKKIKNRKKKKEKVNER